MKRKLPRKLKKKVKKQRSLHLACHLIDTEKGRRAIISIVNLFKPNQEFPLTILTNKNNDKSRSIGS